MRELSDNEIQRTSFEYISSNKWDSQFGYKLPNRNKNEMCPYCKNEDTDIVRDFAFTRKFKEFYSKVNITDFTVVYCYCCEAVWSFYKRKDKRYG